MPVAVPAQAAVIAKNENVHALQRDVLKGSAFQPLQ